MRFYPRILQENLMAMEHEEPGQNIGTSSANDYKYQLYRLVFTGMTVGDRALLGAGSGARIYRSSLPGAAILQI